MAAEQLDRIFVRDLVCRCIVGINDDERVKKQEVRINLVLEADLRRAAGTDSIGDTVDYKDLKVAVLEMVEASQYYLIEHLADRIAAICLEPPMVRRATVTVDKPGALRFAESVAVELTRERGDYFDE
jgi:FolB domain-containing protein